MRQSNEMWMEPSICRETFSQRNDIKIRTEYWALVPFAVLFSILHIPWSKSFKNQHCALIQETRNTIAIVVYCVVVNNVFGLLHTSTNNHEKTTKSILHPLLVPDT